MPSAAPSRRFITPLLVIVLLVLAFLPGKWSVYGPPLHGLISTTLSPFSQSLVWVNAKVRPEPKRPVLAGGDLAKLSDELRYKDALILAAQKRIAELERINADLQGLKRRLGDSYVFRRVKIIGRSSDPAADTFQIGQGARSGIQLGMPVVDGANLVGRVVQVSPTTASVEAITTPGQLIEVLIAPPVLPRHGLPPERGRVVQLRSEGDHELLADDVDRTLPAAVGDYARLDHATGPSAWPTSVQGYIVGMVSEVEPNPDDALRQRLVVRPLMSLRNLHTVTVIIPRDQVPAPAAKEAGS